MSQRTVCIIGVGNRDRGDDGVGSLLAERLARRHCGPIIDAGAVPENHLERVARAGSDTVLIIDAVDFGGDPGECRLLDPHQMGPSGLSSHALSLAMTAEYLKARTQARLALLAIQPVDIRPGSALSDSVSRAAQMAEGAVSCILEGSDYA